MSTQLVTIVQIPVAAGDEEEFAARFESAGVFARAAEEDGFGSARLLRPEEAGSGFVVVTSWDDPEAYQRWQDSDYNPRIQAQFEDLMTGAPTRASYLIAGER